MDIVVLTQVPLTTEAPNGIRLTSAGPYHTPLPVDAAALAEADRIVAELGSSAFEVADALVVNTLADFGVERLRANVVGSVVGAGEASFVAAGMLARRFSIVTVWPPELEWVHRRRLADYGLADRCCAIRSLGPSSATRSTAARRRLLDEATRCDAQLVERVRDEIERSVTYDGAEAVVLGCTCMAAAALMLSGSSPVPVINPERAAIDVAVAVARQVLPLRRR